MYIILLYEDMSPLVSLFLSLSLSLSLFLSLYICLPTSLAFTCQVYVCCLLGTACVSAPTPYAVPLPGIVHSDPPCPLQQLLQVLC